MRAWLLVVAVSAVALAAAAPARAAVSSDGTATWVSAPALAPPPPTGVNPSPYPVELGYVGDIEFWQPNRGVLITAGNDSTQGGATPTGVVPAGVYAYNGQDWHELSTVCGGSDGRIAWAGPDEFWTISDQRPGQVVADGNLENISLCHFLDGAVVGSYAMPLDQPDSYEQMNAAACDAPDDCWFGGDLDASGAFHLHWDGQSITVVDAPQDHAIAAMTVMDDQIYESVQLAPTDSFAGESTANPPVLHIINPSDPNNPFHDLFPANTEDPACQGFCPPLPDYSYDSTSGGPVAPTALGGFALSSDWRAGATDPELWAVAGPPNAQSDANPIILRYADGAWEQAGLAGQGTLLTQNDAPVPLLKVTPVPEDIAAEPNLDAAWISVSPVGVGGAETEGQLVRVAYDPASGAFQVTTPTPVDLGSAQGVGPRGPISAITCPAPEDCWAASTQGWLFHLTDGTQLPLDTDPNFDGVITYRPPDGGVPEVIAGTEPEQGLTPPPLESAPSTPTAPATPAKRYRYLPIYEHVKLTLVGPAKTELQLRFTLTAAARVRLIARRDGRIVAESRMYNLRAGVHTITIALDIHRWPTALKLAYTATHGYKKVLVTPTAPTSSTNPNAVAPPDSSNTVST